MTLSHVPHDEHGERAEGISDEDPTIHAGGPLSEDEGEGRQRGGRRRRKDVAAGGYPDEQEGGRGCGAYGVEQGRKERCGG